MSGGLPRLIREPDAAVHRLGRWTVETRGDEFAEIRFDDLPVVRTVRFVVRDRDWRTIPVASSSCVAGSITVRVEAELAGGGVEYHVELEAEAIDDVLTVRARGTSDSAFLRNRIGLVVLHHPDDAGATARVSAPDGSHGDGAFPTVISPHQPFRDIAAFSWRRPGLDLRLEFAGDVFEMEDQRNWTDASFKTYSTPLSLPFPVPVSPGDVVENELRIVARRDGEAPPGAVWVSSSDVVRLETLAHPVPIPTLSTLIGAESDATAVAALGFRELTAEIDTRHAGWQGELDAVVRVAEHAGAVLDLRLIVVEQGDWLEPIGALRAPVVRLGVFDAATHVTETALRDSVAAVLPAGIELLAGTRAHFTELNRTHERLELGESSVVFSTTPQMHATELRPIIETVSMLPSVVSAARGIAGGRPLRVGPVTVEARFNAVATSADSPVEPIAEQDDLGTHPGYIAWLLATAVGFVDAAVSSLCLARADGIGALFRRGPVLTVPTAAGEAMGRLLNISSPLTAIARTPGLVLAEFGDRMLLVDLSGLPSTRAVEIAGLVAHIEVDGWGIVEIPSPRHE